MIINPEKGDLEIWRNRTIVEDGTVENPNQQISLTDARKIDSTYEVGEEVAEMKLADFGRRAVLSLRQEPGLPDHGPREGQPVQQVYREGRRNHHRRGLSGVEEGDTGIGRRRQRVGAAQVRADSERLFPQRRKREGDRRPRRDEEQFALHRAVAYGSRVPRAAVRDGGSRNLRRPDHDQEDRPHTRRTGQGGRRVVRRPGRSRSAPAWA